MGVILGTPFESYANLHFGYTYIHLMKCKSKRDDLQTSSDLSEVISRKYGGHSWNVF